MGKMDFILDGAAKHTVAVRGTLSNANQDQPNALAQFPGQQPASELLEQQQGHLGHLHRYFDARA